MRSVLALAAAALCLPAAALADVPRVVADIRPVQALAARVMEGAGEPVLLIRPDASPHSYALRPSEAAALEAADLVLWVGHGLTPWLEGTLDALADDAVRLELLDAPGTLLLPFRETVEFAAADSGAHGHEDEHGHNGADGHEDDHEHDHDEGADPHAWLDPVNGKAWTLAIADALAGLDPANAALYEANASAAVAEIDAAAATARGLLEPVRGVPFVVFHDAFQYFETAFGLGAAGAISLGDASAPGPARLTAIGALVQEGGIACVFSEPQFDPRLAETVAAGTGLRRATLDPLGASRAPGPDLYPAILTDMAAAIAACLDRDQN